MENLCFFFRTNTTRYLINHLIHLNNIEQKVSRLHASAIILFLYTFPRTHRDSRAQDHLFTLHSQCNLIDLTLFQ